MTREGSRSIRTELAFRLRRIMRREHIKQIRISSRMLPAKAKEIQGGNPSSLSASETRLELPDGVR